MIDKYTGREIVSPADKLDITDAAPFDSLFEQFWRIAQPLPVLKLPLWYRLGMLFVSERVLWNLPAHWLFPSLTEAESWPSLLPGGSPLKPQKLEQAPQRCHSSAQETSGLLMNLLTEAYLTHNAGSERSRRAHASQRAARLPCSAPRSFPAPDVYRVV